MQPWKVLDQTNFVKKLMGLSIFQVSVIMLYVSMGRVTGGTATIYVMANGAPQPGVVYTNPLPHVLMLTAIVVGIGIYHDPHQCGESLAVQRRGGVPGVYVGGFNVHLPKSVPRMWEEKKGGG